jgi:hypothetical protein
MMRRTFHFVTVAHDVKLAQGAFGLSFRQPGHDTVRVELVLTRQGNNVVRIHGKIVNANGTTAWFFTHATSSTGSSSTGGLSGIILISSLCLTRSM